MRLHRHALVILFAPEAIEDHVEDRKILFLRNQIGPQQRAEILPLGDIDEIHRAGRVDDLAQAYFDPQIASSARPKAIRLGKVPCAAHGGEFVDRSRNGFRSDFHDPLTHQLRRRR